MPTYDYLCGGCGHEFEQFQSMKAKLLRKCPKCGKLKLKRLIGAGAGVIFKGSGFYQTDYRSENYKKGEKTASEKTTTTAAKDTGEKKTETKKTETKDSKPVKKDKSTPGEKK
ncbi:MAG: zinc ribbon domain-containing protein [Phycisphaerae bacterium]|nr:zinc ribbon domain-containing protein [Phycisphaerae bacterium]